MDDYMINRTDSYGRSVYLQDTPASAPTVIFTGAPGMGKSYVLGRAAQSSRTAGDLVLTVNAGSREPLETRLARAVTDQYNELSRSGGGTVLRDLGRLVDRMLGDRNHLAEKALTKLGPLLERLASRLHDANPPSITDLTDRLGDLAQQRGKRLLVVIDNLDSAKQQDLATVAELGGHLRSTDRPVRLAVGASGSAVDALLNAGSSASPTQVRDQYDIRECLPIPDDEVRPALIAGLHRRGAAVQPDGVTRLVHEANGDPGHLTALVSRAASFADPSRGVDRSVAEKTIRSQREADQWAHRAIWSGLSDEARVIVMSTAAHPTGISRDGLPKPADAQAWVEQGKSVGLLVDAGILRRNGDRYAIGDPGFRDWVRTNTAPLPKARRASKRRAQEVEVAQTSSSAERKTRSERTTVRTSGTNRTVRSGTQRDRRPGVRGRRGTQSVRRSPRATGVGRG